MYLPEAWEELASETSLFGIRNDLNFVIQINFLVPVHFPRDIQLEQVIECVLNVIVLYVLLKIG